MSSATDSRAQRNLVVVPRRELSLDFANTVGWRGSEPTESLHTIGELLAWVAATKTVPDRAIGELSKWFEAHPAAAVTVFGAAIEIREVIYRLLRCAAAESAPAREDLRRLNN